MCVLHLLSLCQKLKNANYSNFFIVFGVCGKRGYCEILHCVRLLRFCHCAILWFLWIASHSTNVRNDEVRRRHCET